MASMHQSPTYTVGGRETILVIEDEGAVQTLSGTLQDAGYRVIEVWSVMDGLSLSNELFSRAAVIVADELLGGASGHDLVAVFRHRRPGIPVLYISGAPLAARSAPGLDNRSEFLAKPFDREALLHRVRRLIDG
jgi:DNA-binding response OmpR family regulator